MLTLDFKVPGSGIKVIKMKSTRYEKKARSEWSRNHFK
jgi:hypothetical protein